MGIVKRHRWSIKIKGSQTISKTMYSGKKRKMHLSNIKECANCGLRNGTHKVGWNWVNTVYYDKHEKTWLSENKIPHSCSRRNDMLFKKDEFML